MRGHGKRLDEIHAVEVRHVDVAEDGVYGIVLQIGACLECALELGYELQIWDVVDVGGQLSESQWLVINGNTAYHGI